MINFDLTDRVAIVTGEHKDLDMLYLRDLLNQGQKS